ncbi:hypothetical protein IEQ34_008112 [Dendrobium chrysotoxum]|uniref:Uncharacterized protein n=1 Tax=Dendrobium chrysotoxum TaxID=161865 RepID=A0AAV7GNT6_DENCH|nr:hypothetical protein IEQ34_008112 [Dendrobium chrysotoxum]
MSRAGQAASQLLNFSAGQPPENFSAAKFCRKIFLLRSCLKATPNVTRPSPTFTIELAPFAAISCLYSPSLVREGRHLRLYYRYQNSKKLDKDFCWLPQHNDKNRKNFTKCGSTRMRDIFIDIRKSGVYRASRELAAVGEGCIVKINFKSQKKQMRCDKYKYLRVIVEDLSCTQHVIYWPGRSGSSGRLVEKIVHIVPYDPAIVWDD